MAPSTITILTLPPELRQRIFLLTVDSENATATLLPLAPSVYHLTQTCTTIRNDMRWVLSYHMPTYSFLTPALFRSFLSALSLRPPLLQSPGQAPPTATPRPAYDYLPPLTTISFSLFHDASVDTMHWTCYCRGPAHQELIAAWIESTPLLQYLPSVSTVLLDVTPAPGWMRAQRPDWIPNFVKDRRVAKMFITEHRDPIIALIQVLTARGLEVQLTGLLSVKSATFLADMVDDGKKRGLDVVFTGRLAPTESQRRGPGLYTSIRSLAPVRYGWLDATQARTSIADGEGSFGRLPPRNQFEYCAAKLGTTSWGKDTESLWEKEVQVDEKWAMGVLRRFVDFVRDEEDVEKVFEPVHSRKRALIHRLAGNLGFKTQSLGEGDERYVRVHRERVEGDAEKGWEVDLGRLKDITI